MKLPKAQLILDYQAFYGEEPPVNRVELISHLNKVDVLAEFVALNYRLKPNDALFIDTTFETQIAELRYFTRLPNLFSRYKNLYDRHYRSSQNGSRAQFPIVFTRQTCLFAMEELINSEAMQEIDKPAMSTLSDWEAILKYIFSVNSALTALIEQVPQGEKVNVETVENIDKKSNIDFEEINAKMISLNELNIESDLAYTLYRGYSLFNFLLNHLSYKEITMTYFTNTYALSFEQFIVKLMTIYFINDGEFKFFYYIEEKYTKFFNDLSTRIPNNNIYNLLSIKKAPFYKVRNEMYLITDLQFLIDKAYYQFINDFWFDCLKCTKNSNQKLIFKFDTYKSDLGYFFEMYVNNLLRVMLQNFKYSTLLTFNELKLYKRNGNIELADLYFRYDNKILLGEVKGGSLYDNEKYSGDLTKFYKGNREEFFENFGINQIVKSIINLKAHIGHLDKKFDDNKTYQIFPCIILNEKAFQTPLMPDIFNNRFQELIKEHNIPKLRIKPLTIICINELERIVEPLKESPAILWKLLNYHTNNGSYITTFTDTIHKLKVPYKFPTLAMAALSELDRKHKNTIFK